MRQLTKWTAALSGVCFVLLFFGLLVTNIIRPDLIYCSRGDFVGMEIGFFAFAIAAFSMALDIER